MTILIRLSNFMSFYQSLMKAFVESQFGYCPLIWMFSSRKNNIRINHIHERALRAVYKDNFSSFESLLKKDQTFSIHHRNIQFLAIELFKVKHGIANNIMDNIFDRRELDYNLRSQTDFFRSFVNTSRFGLNSLKYFASKVWNLIPPEIKNSENIEFFTHKIKKWEPIGCDCNLCSNYVKDIGYIHVS